MFTHTIMENEQLSKEIYRKIISREKSYSAILAKAIEIDYEVDDIDDIDDKSLFFNEFEVKYKYSSHSKTLYFFVFGPLKMGNNEVFGQFLWFNLSGNKIDFEGNHYISESEEKLILKFLDDLYNLSQYKDSILQKYF